MSDERSSRSTARAETNRNIRKAVKRFDLSELETETWDFLCECGDDDCERWITLTLAEYEALREKDEPILTAGHTVDDAALAPRKAHALAENTNALRAQAGIQEKRVARNARGDGD